LPAIASCGRESAAAELLGVTQPAVHATLQALERSVGVRLFYKLPFGTRLTPAGEALLRRVKLALAEIRAMESDLAAWRGEVRGKIVVGVLPLSVPIFLPRAVQALANRHPDIQVEIVDGTYESLMRQLLGAEVDAIAGALRSDVPDDEVRQLHLFDDDLVIIARKGHPSLRAKGLGLQDLLRWQWVRPLAHTPADRALEQVFRAQRLDPPRAGLRAGSPTLTLAFVIQTGLLALASRGQAIVDNQGGQLCIVPVPLPSTVRRIGLTLRAVGAPSHDLQLFLQSCRSTVSGRSEQPESS
jgi:DNA-binding transcriptional LysR family regulator